MNPAAPGPAPTAVLGVDGCRQGWVGIELRPGSDLRAVAAVRFEELVAAVGDVGVVAVDMPVGLSECGTRQADLAARRVLGGRRATLFVTPVKQAVEAATYADASAINRRITGSGISRQAWALSTKILEVESWRGGSGRQPWEVHPEIVFAELAGRPLLASKKTWAGQCQRRELLESVGIALPADLGAAGLAAGPDDVLDAAAVAWTARRIATGVARSLPDPPELDHLGRPMAIWV
jgi:predicted RNase H-like nuclease